MWSMSRESVCAAWEARRSQYDFSGGFHSPMSDALPNGSCGGFARTPIEKADVNATCRA